MTREEFWEWMKTCPADKIQGGQYTDDKAGWFIANDEIDNIRVFFWFASQETDDE